MTHKEFTFSLTSLRLDENYHPAKNTRATTNFANLARGHSRQENLRNTLQMINNRFNALACWDNPQGDRYSIELDIISFGIDIEKDQHTFPSVEMLKTTIIDRKRNKRIDGIVGNNFSSYVRDYDFSVVLSEHNKDKENFSIPKNFGDLHGNIFKKLVKSRLYQESFSKPPVICISVSENKIYHKTENRHPILGVEYQPNESSLTETYFKKMGVNVRYFMPVGSVAPLAFYFFGDLLNDYTQLELISTVSTMETFQKIYRPEIYNANSVAGKCYKPKLYNSDYSFTKIIYDREERSKLADTQGQFTEEFFIKPYQTILEKWTDCRI